MGDRNNDIPTSANPFYDEFLRGIGRSPATTTPPRPSHRREPSRSPDYLGYDRDYCYDSEFDMPPIPQPYKPTKPAPDSPQIVQRAPPLRPLLPRPNLQQQQQQQQPTPALKIRLPGFSVGVGASAAGGSAPVQPIDNPFTATTGMMDLAAPARFPPRKPSAAGDSTAAARKAISGSGSAGGNSSSTVAPAGRQKKVVWHLPMDKALYRQVIATQPHLAEHGSTGDLWAQVSKELRDCNEFAAHEKLSATCVQARFAKLQKNFQLKLEKDEYESGEREGNDDELHSAMFDIQCELDIRDAERRQDAAAKKKVQERQAAHRGKTKDSAMKESGTAKRKKRSEGSAKKDSPAPTPVVDLVGGFLRGKTDSPATKKRKLDIEEMKAMTARKEAETASQQAQSNLELMRDLVGMLKGNMGGNV